jgi:hypothetical protein
VWWHGGSPCVVPGASLPHFRHKKLIKKFWNFKKLYFWRFSEIDK